MGQVKNKALLIAAPSWSCENPLNEALAGNVLVKVPGESNSHSLIAKSCGRRVRLHCPDPQEPGEGVTGTETHQGLFLGHHRVPSCSSPCVNSSLASSPQTFHLFLENSAGRIFQILFEPEPMNCSLSTCWLEKWGSEPTCLHLFLGMPAGIACSCTRRSLSLAAEPP